jgi:hypothetical protein
MASIVSIIPTEEERNVKADGSRSTISSSEVQKIVASLTTVKEALTVAAMAWIEPSQPPTLGLNSSS